MNAPTFGEMEPAWTWRAGCRSRDPEDFFVDDIAVDATGVPTFTMPVIRAKDVCADCPVRRECLEWAFEAEGDDPGERRYGVYGGVMGRERELVADEPRRIELLLWAFELQRKQHNLGSMRRWSRRGMSAVG